MNVLFLTLLDFNSIHERGIYTDLLREFVRSGHHVFVVSPTEKRFKRKTRMLVDEGVQILKLQIGNIQKTNPIEKGFTTLTLGDKYMLGVKQFLSEISFDLVICSTPPITLTKAIRYVKNRDNAKVYLLLKDIFPQNAVDLGMLSPRGIKGFVYRFFRGQEKALYEVCDYIGCMSEANVTYVKANNPELEKKPVEVCPNSIEPLNGLKSREDRNMIRNRYGIPLDKIVFIYGGNLGKPQGIEFLLDVIRHCKNHPDIYIVAVGSGTEYAKAENFFREEAPPNALLIKQLPKEDYDLFLSACDVGMIFLDRRFTIPNFPSRLLSYMEYSIPIIAATDRCTDISAIMMRGQFGLWCESAETNTRVFYEMMQQLMSREAREMMGQNARRFLEEHYTAEQSYKTIVRHFEKRGSVCSTEKHCL